MLTIKLYLAESGSVASIDKDFPLYQGQYQNILLNVFVPLSLLAPNFTVQTENGSYDGIDTPYVAGTAVSVACRAVRPNGKIATSAPSNLRYVKTMAKNGVGYALYERKLPKSFTNYAGTSPAGLTMVVNVTNVEYGTINSTQTTVSVTTGDITATISNFNALAKAVPAVSAKYKFLYSGSNASWYLNGNKVSIETYGITVGGTPVDGDTILLAVGTDNPTVKSILTTQTVKYDVFPSSELEQDTPADASAVAELQAMANDAKNHIAAIEEVLPKKQDISEPSLTTSAKTIPAAINELDTDTKNLNTRVTQNEVAISDLRDLVASGIDYVGTMETTSEPTGADLFSYVEQERGKNYTYKGGEFVLAVQTIDDDNDKIYACIYSLTNDWQIIPVPAVEIASTDAYGLMKGGANADGTVYVTVVGGQISNISVKKDKNSVAVPINQLATLNEDLNAILAGTKSVPKAVTAERDGSGRNIASTYMDKEQGATKTYVRQYALPVEFNDALYVTSEGLKKSVPSTPVQFTATSSSLGYTDLFTVAYDLAEDGGVSFQLSKKNSFNGSIYLSATAADNVKVRVEMSAGSSATGDGNDTLCIYEDAATSAVGTDITKFEINSLFTALGEKILTLDGSKGAAYIVMKASIFRETSAAQTLSVYCTDTAPSSVHLSTAFQTVAITSGKVGEIPQMNYTSASYYQGVVTFSPDMPLPPANSIVHVTLPTMPTGSYDEAEVKIKIGGADVTPASAYGGKATAGDLKQVAKAVNGNITGYDFLMSAVSDGDGLFSYRIVMDNVPEENITALAFSGSTAVVTSDGMEVGGTTRVTVDRGYGESTARPAPTEINLPIVAGNGINITSDGNKFTISKTGSDVTANPETTAESPDMTSIKIGDTSYTVQKAALDGKLDKSTTSPDTKYHLYAYKASAGGGEAEQTELAADMLSTSGGSLARRNSDGSILAEKTSLTSGDTYNKSVVNHGELDPALAKKIDKVESTSANASYLYGTKAGATSGGATSQTQTTYIVDTAATGSSVPLRDSAGRMKAALPSADDDVANKEFVNSSITNMAADYISNNGEPFTSLAALNTYTAAHPSEVANHDYAVVVGKDSAGNTTYTRYTYNGTQWNAEYTLNNSSFTAAQWATINSGATKDMIESIGQKVDKSTVRPTSGYSVYANNSAGAVEMVVANTDGRTANTIPMTDANGVLHLNRSEDTDAPVLMGDVGIYDLGEIGVDVPFSDIFYGTSAKTIGYDGYYYHFTETDALKFTFVCVHGTSSGYGIGGVEVYTLVGTYNSDTDTINFAEGYSGVKPLYKHHLRFAKNVSSDDSGFYAHIDVYTYSQTKITLQNFMNTYRNAVFTASGQWAQQSGSTTSVITMISPYSTTLMKIFLYNPQGSFGETDTTETIDTMTDDVSPVRL